MDWNNLTSGLAGAVLGSILGPLVQGYTYGYFKEQQEKWESKKFKHVLSSELKELKKPLTILTLEVTGLLFQLNI